MRDAERSDRALEAARRLEAEGDTAAALAKRQDSARYSALSKYWLMKVDNREARKHDFAL